MLKRFALITVVIALFSTVAPVFDPPMLNELSNPGSAIRAKQLWKDKAPVEYKFFLWLATQDRCWTNGRRHRHGLTYDVSCALCLQHEEEINHLLLGCVYNHEVWFLMLSKFGWQQLSSAVEEAAMSWWL
jgi:hypothetical protein